VETGTGSLDSATLHVAYIPSSLTQRNCINKAVLACMLWKIYSSKDIGRVPVSNTSRVEPYILKLKEVYNFLPIKTNTHIHSLNKTT